MRTRIKFNESSKAVTAEVLVELSDEEKMSHDDHLNMTIALFEKAQRYSTQKTMEKMR